MRVGSLWKVFGAAFDPLDHPEKLALQRAYLWAYAHNLLDPGLPIDPYELVLAHLTKENAPLPLLPIGRFEIPSWLRPRPDLQDYELLDRYRFSQFLEANGCRKVAQDLKHYVATEVFPERPLMVGVDHSLTGGVLEAIAEKLGPQNYSLLVLDSHFDGISHAIRRLSQGSGDGQGVCGEPCGERIGIERASVQPAEQDEFYSCGNFLTFLFDNTVLDPSHTIVVGVTDSPWDRTSTCSRPVNQQVYADAYEACRSKGVTFIPGGDQEACLVARLDRVQRFVRHGSMFP